jgi:voltage-gated potassium channel Kch
LQKILFRICYSIIYFVAVFSLKKRPVYLIVLFVVTFLLDWISGIFQLPLLLVLARSINILFFLVVVFSMIRQIAAAKEVNAVVILGSIIGYLLLGIIYSIFISLIMYNDPAAFNKAIPDNPSGESGTDTSVPLYFSFVTLATLGYGDIVPVKPYTRAFATLITVSGQFYIAIIVALLVGKFSARRGKADET